MKLLFSVIIILASVACKADIEKVLDIIEKSKKGSHLHQEILANMYFDGYSFFERDWRKAADLYAKAAGSSLSAKFKLAEMMESGKGVVQNTPKALQLYKEASKEGYMPATAILFVRKEIQIPEGYESNGDFLCAVAHHYHKSGEYQGLKWWKKAAEQGCSYAMYVMGNRIVSHKLNGCLNCRSFKEGNINKSSRLKARKSAISWYIKSAVEGYTPALLKMPDLYEDLSFDKLLLQAAYSDNTLAQFKLAKRFYKKNDYFQSYVWSNIAASRLKRDYVKLAEVIKKQRAAQLGSLAGAVAGGARLVRSHNFSMTASLMLASQLSLFGFVGTFATEREKEDYILTLGEISPFRDKTSKELKKRHGKERLLEAQKQSFEKSKSIRERKNDI